MKCLKNLPKIYNVKRSIPKSLAIRAENLCSDQADFNSYIDKLSNALIGRGYPQKTVENQVKCPKNQNKDASFKSDPKFIVKM